MPTLRSSSTVMATATSFTMPSLTPSSTVTITVTNTLPATSTPLPTAIPTDRPISPTGIVKASSTPRPRSPTATKPPKTTVTCGVIPNIISGAENAPLIFWAQFSPPMAGLGISGESFSLHGSGQHTCIGSSDGNGYADCTGSSGMLPYKKTVTVTIETSAGNCTAYFYTQ